MLPDKTLFNIGMDAAQSDVVLMTPLYGVLHSTNGQEDGDLLSLVSHEVLSNPSYAIVFQIGQSEYLYMRAEFFL